MARSRRFRLRGPVPWALAALLVLLASPVDAREKLVPANPGQMQQTDGRGFNWDPTTEGVIRDGTSDCFDDAIRLKINGGPFRPNKPPMQTKDGREFVFQGVVGQIGVTRRLKIQSEHGAIRCVEIFENKSKRAVRVNVEIWSMLGGGAQGAMTNLGRAIVNGPLQKGETSIFAVQRPQGRPSVIFQLRGPRTKATPVVTVQNNRTFSVVWTVNIPAGRSTALMHGLAQRRFSMQPPAKQMETELKPMLDAKWVSGLPGSVRTSIMNHNASGGSAEELTEAAPAHQEVLALAKAYEYERGTDATVFIDRDKPLKGTAQGSTLDVDTRMGPVSVPFDDVAVLRGGAGVGRSMRLFLRDGEILAGDIAAPKLVFKTSSGLDIPLDPAGIDALFLPASKTDGAVAENTYAFLTQLDGTKLALEKGEAGALEAVSPWGDLQIPIDAVVRIRYAREPLPGLWILLRDGSRFPLAVRGDAWQLESRRFGTVEVAPGTIAAWSRHGVAADVTKGEDDEVMPSRTHTQLVGGCFLVGTLADKQLTVETVAGATPIEVPTIRSIDRSDEAEGSVPIFEFELMSGEKVQGRLARPLVNVQTPRGACRVPVLHLWAYRWAPDPEAPTPEDGDGDAKDGDAKDGDAKDEDAKDVEVKEPTPPKDAPEKGDAPKKNDAPAKKDAPKKKAAPKAAPKGGAAGKGTR